jgi:hypothetical protein
MAPSFKCSFRRIRGAVWDPTEPYLYPGGTLHLDRLEGTLPVGAHRLAPNMGNDQLFDCFRFSSDVSPNSLSAGVNNKQRRRYCIQFLLIVTGREG